MADIFRQTGTRRIGTNLFNHSHDHMTTFRIGELVPTATYNTMPGDRWELGQVILARMPPLRS